MVICWVKSGYFVENNRWWKIENRRHLILDVNNCVLDVVLNFSKPNLWIFPTFVYILKRNSLSLKKNLRKLHNYFKYENLHVLSSLIIKHLSLVLQIWIDFECEFMRYFQRKMLTSGRMDEWTDIRTDGQLETDGRTNRHHQSISNELCYNSAKKTYEINYCQNDTCLFWNKHLPRYILAYILCILVSGTYNQHEQLKYIYKGALQILGNIFLKTTIINFINFGLKHQKNA